MPLRDHKTEKFLGRDTAPFPSPSLVGRECWRGTPLPTPYPLRRFVPQPWTVVDAPARDRWRQTSVEANMSVTTRETGIWPSVDRKYRSSIVSALTDRKDASSRSSLPKRNGWAACRVTSIWRLSASWASSCSRTMVSVSASDVIDWLPSPQLPVAHSRRLLNKDRVTDASCHWKKCS